MEFNEAVSDEELTHLALSGEFSAAFEPGVTPWRGAWGSAPLLVPEWYMPRPTGRRRMRGTGLIVILVIVGFLLVDAFGLCLTSGFLTLA